MLERITGFEASTDDLFDELKKMLLDDEIMLVIKNPSLSGMPKKDIGNCIRDIFKIMDDAWIKIEHGKLEHKNPKSALIVLDFPNFLEKYYDEIGYYAIPVYPKFELNSYRKSPSPTKK